MGVYVCTKCKKRYRNKDFLTIHLSQCDGVVPFTYKTEKYTCEKCDKIFYSLSTLNRHIRSIHQAIAIFNEPNEGQSTQHVTNNITKNITKNITNITDKSINIENLSIDKSTNINIKQLLFAKPGEERIDHITKEFLLKVLNYTSSQRMFVELMEELYFSSEVPENNNWTLAYPYNDKAAVVYDYDAQKFKRTSTEAVINEKFANMINKLVPVMEEIKEDFDNLTKEQQLNIRHFFDKECVYDISVQYPEIYNLVHKLAYEKRFVPMKSWKEQGLSGNHLSLKF
jgi:hypothetical protein